MHLPTFAKISLYIPFSKKSVAAGRYLAKENAYLGWVPWGRHPWRGRCLIPILSCELVGTALPFTWLLSARSRRIFHRTQRKSLMNLKKKRRRSRMQTGCFNVFWSSTTVKECPSNSMLPLHASLRSRLRKPWMVSWLHLLPGQRPTLPWRPTQRSSWQPASVRLLQHVFNQRPAWHACMHACMHK